MARKILAGRLIVEEVAPRKILLGRMIFEDTSAAVSVPQIIAMRRLTNNPIINM